MRQGPLKPMVHLELLTGDSERARAFYIELCGWRPRQIGTASCSYLALELGPSLGGGIVECETQRPLWLPYFEVEAITAATEQARRLGAAVVLEPREGPAGWRSVVTTAAGGAIAFWQSKR